MNNKIILPYNIEKKMSIAARKEYYKDLRRYCIDNVVPDINNYSFGQKVVTNLYMKDFYNKRLELEGVENLDMNQAIFLCNHSTAHDIFSMYNIMERLKRKTTVMVATDCLNPFSIATFKLADATFLDRNSKKSANNSILLASAKVLKGKNLVIFGEATWNLHPFKLMHDIKKGGTMISAITSVPVVPTILEYLEEPRLCDKELDLYKKIIVRFGKPLSINNSDDIIIKTLEIQTELEKIRREIWQDNGVNRTSLSDIDQDIYLNHTYQKKYKAFGFTYDSLKEEKFLRSNDGSKIENEYCLDENNKLVPGITPKKKILKLSN